MLSRIITNKITVIIRALFVMFAIRFTHPRLKSGVTTIRMPLFAIYDKTLFYPISSDLSESSDFTSPLKMPRRLWRG